MMMKDYDQQIQTDRLTRRALEKLVLPGSNDSSNYTSIHNTIATPKLNQEIEKH